jgi:hypothetical protein
MRGDVEIASHWHVLIGARFPFKKNEALNQIQMDENI